MRRSCGPRRTRVKHPLRPRTRPSPRSRVTSSPWFAVAAAAMIEACDRAPLPSSGCSSSPACSRSRPRPRPRSSPVAARRPRSRRRGPSTRLEIGFADSPGGAAALHADAPFGLRYQYLAGGVNTGNGWATWNTNGDFVKWYVAGLGRERHRARVPVLHAPPEQPRDRQRRGREGPQQPQERHDDGRLLGRRPPVHAEGRGGRVGPPGRAARRARPVGLHRAGGDRRRCEHGPGVGRLERRCGRGRLRQQRDRLREGDPPPP